VHPRVRTLAAAGALLVLAGLGAGGVVTAASYDVSIVDFAFQPRQLTVEVGEPVTWTNEGTRNHTVTSDQGSELDSGTLAPGEAYGHVFEEPGTYRYHCEIHPDRMTGVVRVVASTVTEPPGSPQPTPPLGTLPPNFSPFPTTGPFATPTATPPPVTPAPATVGPVATPTASPETPGDDTAAGIPAVALLVAALVVGGLAVVLAGFVRRRSRN
jgi:plastocyanin